ncbi:MAG: type II toxin-antitoxin system RelE/ParE family toxin [Cyclobacteriaceae bacterium]|nr:type II toxin-antitoxin system RelE/ParE family toxin [Cyclobacteriaceae bacterium]
MAKYRFTKKAVGDLTHIWNYTVNVWSENQAERYYRQLLTFCKEVASNPHLGKSYDGVAKNLFGLRANYHIIFYRVIKENEIEIVRILHERMDLKNRISDK